MLCKISTLFFHVKDTITLFKYKRGIKRVKRRSSAPRQDENAKPTLQINHPPWLRQPRQAARPSMPSANSTRPVYCEYKSHVRTVQSLCTESTKSLYFSHPHYPSPPPKLSIYFYSPFRFSYICVVREHKHIFTNFFEFFLFFKEIIAIFAGHLEKSINKKSIFLYY